MEIEGKMALKLVGALLATIDQRDPGLIDALHGMLAMSASDPIGNIAAESVSAIIESRAMRG